MVVSLMPFKQSDSLAIEKPQFRFGYLIVTYAPSIVSHHNNTCLSHRECHANLDISDDPKQ